MAKRKTKSAGDGGTTLVTFLLDRTGSMQIIKQDTMGAFNAYLDTLSKGGADIKFTLLQFDSVSLDKVCVEVPVAQAPRLNDDNYEPRATTPLIDAAVKTIKAVEKSVEGKPDTKVVICIQTDGQENASREHSWEELNDLIKEKTNAGWQFNFMGAGIDAYKQATRMGLSAGQTMSYSTDTASTMAAFTSRARATHLYATGGITGMSISADEKAAAGDIYAPGGSGGGKPASPGKQDPMPDPQPRRPRTVKPIVNDVTL